MSRYREVALTCKIKPGGFSGERVVLIAKVDGEYRGLAPRRYCWHENKEPLEADKPADGQTIPGLVAAIALNAVGADRLIVSVPDGEILEVPKNTVTDRPMSEATEDVPLRS